LEVRAVRRTRSQRLEARRRELEDQVVVYALTGRRPPERLVMAYVRARTEALAAAHGETGAPARHGVFDRWFAPTAAG
jgi:hypothetical protein